MGKHNRQQEKLAKQHARAARAVGTQNNSPVLGVEPKGGDGPTIAVAPDNWDGHKPSWLFQRMDHGGPWSVDAVGTQLAEVRDKLKEFERLTWKEIRRDTGSHPIAISDLCPGAQARLRHIQLDMYDELYSLRITGRRRLWGIKDGRSLLILWWDPEHEVCPSIQAHT